MNQNQVRALGIDYGEARIGVAMSDALGMLAHPYETIDVHTGRSIPRITEIIAKEKISVLVIGVPRSLNGKEGPAAIKVREFIERIKKVLPPRCELRCIDERLTTAGAQKSLHASGKNTKNSRPIIDQVAAQWILQTYLDTESLRAGGAGWGESEAEDPDPYGHYAEGAENDANERAQD